MVVETVRDANRVAQTWRLVEANAAWERITDLSHVAARGLRIEAIAHAWTTDPSIFKINPRHLIPEPNRPRRLV